jgi:hypothetical protein
MSMVSKFVSFGYARQSAMLVRSILLCVSAILLITSPLLAQERTAGDPLQKGDKLMQSRLAASIQASMTALAAELNLQCTTSALSTPANTAVSHGTDWTEQCPAGFTGSLTKTCVHGVTAIKENGCRSARPCGARQSGDTWTGSCAEGLTGQLVYQCLDGNVVILPTEVNPASKCEKHDCHGTSYTTACPAMVEGTAMSGDITYSCTNNVLSMTGNTCHTYNRPCGTHQHGTSWNSPCGYGMGGSVVNTCYDSNTYSYPNGCELPIQDAPFPVYNSFQGCAMTASWHCGTLFDCGRNDFTCSQWVANYGCDPGAVSRQWFTLEGNSSSGYYIANHHGYCAATPESRQGSLRYVSACGFGNITTTQETIDHGC